MNGQAQFAAVLHERKGLFDGDSLLHIVQHFLDAGFEAHYQKPAARFLHCLEHVVVGMHPAVAGPGEIELLEVLAQLDYAAFFPTPRCRRRKIFPLLPEKFRGPASLRQRRFPCCERAMDAR